MTTLSQTMVSPWIAIPLAAVGMVLVAGYTLAIQRDDVPRARRKIRTALGLLHIFILGALAYGVSVASIDDKKASAIVWLLVIGLVAASVSLAIADALVTLKLALRERREEARRAAEALAQDLLKARQERATQKPQGPGGAGGAGAGGVGA